MICQSAVSLALRRYHLRMGAAMGLFIIFCATAERVVRGYALTPAWRYVWALLPAIPMLVAIVIAGRYIAEEKDEFQRYRFLQALLIATGVLLSMLVINDVLRSFAVSNPMPPFLCVIVFFTSIALVSLIQVRMDRAGRHEK